MNALVTNMEQELKPAGSAKSLAVSDSAVGFPEIPGRYDYVMIDVIGADVRFTVDGTDPVGGTSGHLLANGSHRIWHKNFASVSRYIRNADTDAAVYITPLTK